VLRNRMRIRNLPKKHYINHHAHSNLPIYVL
jgi:hypothetical protein